MLDVINGVGPGVVVLIVLSPAFLLGALVGVLADGLMCGF